ncbi:MAG: restriction endonuclease subunit S [Acidimicrobiales bacterium]
MKGIETLDDVCSAIVDCEHKTAPISEHGQYFATGTPAMRGNVIDYEESRPINRETFEAWTRRLRPAVGDVLLAREAPVGPVVRIPPLANTAPGQRTVLLRPDPTKVDTRFLYYFLTSPLQQARLRASAEGSTVAHLNVADIRNFKLPQFPSVSVQRAIAEVLGALDDKIAANQAISSTTDALVAALFSRICVSSATSSLSGIASVNVTTVQPSPGGKLRYLDIASVGQGRYESPDLMEWNDAPSRARRAVQRGDTVWSTVRPNRRSHALVLESDPMFVASTGLAVLTPHPGRVACLFESTRRPEFETYLESVAEGSAYPAVNANRFEQAPVPNLEAEAWDAFESLAMPLRERAHAAEMESDRLAVTRDALLPLLMSGKVRVKDLEKIAEEAL